MLCLWFCQKNVANEEEADVDGDAFEALFTQLEEDLKNDPSIEDEDGELTEKELAKLQSQLEEAMLEDDDLFNMLGAAAGDAMYDDNDEEEEDGELEGEDEEEVDDEDKSVKLKSWQLRRLARALKVGRRKISVSSLFQFSFVLYVLGYGLYDIQFAQCRTTQLI